MKVAATAIVTPTNTLPRVDRLWAYLSVDPATGNEGVCAATLPTGLLFPLIASDQNRLAWMTPLAEQLAAETGMAIRLVEFASRVDVRTITGRADG